MPRNPEYLARKAARRAARGKGPSQHGPACPTCGDPCKCIHCGDWCRCDLERLKAAKKSEDPTCSTT